jgi:hypothetical protein
MFTIPLFFILPAQDLNICMCTYNRSVARYYAETLDSNALSPSNFTRNTQCYIMLKSENHLHNSPALYHTPVSMTILNVHKQHLLQPTDNTYADKTKL